MEELELKIKELEASIKYVEEERDEALSLLNEIKDMLRKI